MLWSSAQDHSVCFLKMPLVFVIFKTKVLRTKFFFYAQFLICVMVLPKGEGSLINEVYDAMFCLHVNLSGDDHSVATVLWLQRFYDMFERLGLHSNRVSCVHVPVPSVLWVRVNG